MPIKAARHAAYWALAGALATASFSNSLFEITSGVFLGLSLLLVTLEKRTDIFKTLFGAAVAVYFLTVLLSLTQSGYPAESARGAFRVLRCALMSFFTVYLVDDEGKYKKIFYILAASAALVGLDALGQGVFGVEFLRSRTMTPYLGQTLRVTGPFNHANDLSAYLAMLIFVFLGMLPFSVQNRSWKETLAYSGGALVLGACLLWTYSRGAWVAVLIGCLFMAAVKRSCWTFAALAVSVALVFALSPESVKHRAASLWSPADGTVSERRELWGEAFRIVHERPWLGYGINTYAKMEPQFKSKTVYTDNQYAHNGYLQIAAETGWLGLASFLAVVACFFATTLGPHLKRPRDFLSASALSLSFGLLAFLAHSATDTDLQSLRLVSLFWLAMGLVLAAKNISGAKVR